MELKRRVLQFKFEDENVELKFPTVIHMSKYAKDIKASQKKDDGKMLDIMMDMLVTLGLPIKLKDQLEPEHVENIMAAISPKKADEGK